MSTRAKPKLQQKRSYGPALREFKESNPMVHSLLAAAETNRLARLKRWSGGVRFRGIDELLSHLDALAVVYGRNRRLKKIAFLLRRARGDFEAAIEATLSGLHSVTHDAMRDVMEIEFLLREFSHEPTHIEEWLTVDEDERYRRFRPGRLRQRHATRLGVRPSDMSEAADYRGHSMMLHVSPYSNPFGNPGIVRETDPFIADSCFWEIFEHGRRLLIVAHELRRKLAPHLKSPWGPRRGLKAFRIGWQATRQMQVIFMALVEAGQKSNESSDP